MRKIRHLAVMLPLVAVVAVIAAIVQRGEQHSRGELEERFYLRSRVAEAFLQAYVQDVQQRQRQAATLNLAAPEVTFAEVATVAQAFGFDAAVLFRGWHASAGVPRPPRTAWQPHGRALRAPQLCSDDGSCSLWRGAIRSRGNARGGVCHPFRDA